MCYGKVPPIVNVYRLMFLEKLQELLGDRFA